MDDVHSFHTRSYEKANSDDFEISPMRRTLVLLSVLPSLIVKTLFVLAAEIYYLLEAIFHFFVPKTLKDIRGQLAAVTGGSNGIGREICLELARSGCNIACMDVDLEAAQKLCTEIKLLGVKAHAYKVDVTDYDGLEQVKKEINADLGIVDILVNNAGLMPQDSFRDSEPDAVRRVMDVNVLAHFWTTRIFIGDMIARRSGYIVGISSMIAFYPMSTAVTYTTSKYAVKGFMDALNRETRHEDWGVKTLTVFPHLTSTRKEIMDYVKRKVHSSTLERVGVIRPSDVGKETVLALRSGSRYVSVPRYYLLCGKFFQSMPSEVQDIADEVYMPRLTSKTNYMATKKSSAFDNGCKKSN